MNLENIIEEILSLEKNSNKNIESIKKLDLDEAIKSVETLMKSNPRIIEDIKNVVESNLKVSKSLSMSTIMLLLSGLLSISSANADDFKRLDNNKQKSLKLIMDNVRTYDLAGRQVSTHNYKDLKGNVLELIRGLEDMRKISPSNIDKIK